MEEVSLRRARAMLICLKVFVLPRRLTWIGAVCGQPATTLSGDRDQSSLASLECAEIVGNVWIFRRQRFDIADFDVDFLYARPFCARAEEPAPLSDHACSVKRITPD